ncbi:MAG: magnesium-translocating P-type ATPase [Candidatus Methanomethyliaceae archaeon]|nr:magnesium-translocating P-type ATPase [Candidatus Methanomethyliaceae archaeon]
MHNETQHSAVRTSAYFGTEDAISLKEEQLFSQLGSSPSGLSSEKASELLELYGPNEITKKKRRSALSSFLSHIRNPLVIILLIAGTIAGFVGEVTNAIIIYTIVALSVSLSFYQESKAEKAAESLQRLVATTATVIRDDVRQEIPVSKVVPGDVILLAAGDLVPADARVLSAKDFFVDQSALTGESFPVEKFSEPIPPTASIVDWKNFIFMGTSVVSGSCTAIVVRTGNRTEFGRIAKTLLKPAPDTEFQRGLRRFGTLIMQTTFSLVIFVFFVLALLKEDPLQSLLFAVALAVGLTPELLPMILTINLSRGAVEMSKKGVIVKRLASIQNFGNMDVLCTDKTGTLTENRVTLILHVNIDGEDDEKVFLYSYLNSLFQTGLRSPLDDAVLAHKPMDVLRYKKVDEVPFDFTRRRVSVIVDFEGERLFITKGAPEDISAVCSYYESRGHVLDKTSEVERKIQQKFRELSEEGYRVLALSYKRLKDAKTRYSIADESDMVFLGFIAFLDPPKESARDSVKLLEKAGIKLKILTGDNEIVTKKICKELGIEVEGVVLGSELPNISDEALSVLVEKANIFARLTPAQKNRVINTLRYNGHVVGFLGDGINDAPSMKVADVGISVNNAVDVAKESADIILLNKDLTVLNEGVIEGRKTFGNTMKYILMAISSNFGNMFSAAGASIFLPFLPMLPIQILLNNFLYDVSEFAITTDRVDEEYMQTPKRLNITIIRRFMVYFGGISSLFDFLTFFLLLTVFAAWDKPALFQTAWFIESLCTQTLVVFVIRTRRTPFYRSLPSRALLLTTLSIVLFAISLPLTIVGSWFGFVAPPAMFYPFLLIIVGSYLAMVEAAKAMFYRRYKEQISASA